MDVKLNKKSYQQTNIYIYIYIELFLDLDTNTSRSNEGDVEFGDCIDPASEDHGWSHGNTLQSCAPFASGPPVALRRSRTCPGRQVGSSSGSRTRGSFGET